MDNDIQSDYYRVLIWFKPGNKIVFKNSPLSVRQNTGICELQLLALDQESLEDVKQIQVMAAHLPENKDFPTILFYEGNNDIFMQKYIESREMDAQLSKLRKELKNIVECHVTKSNAFNVMQQAGSKGNK